jgi:hypothetical protein
MIALRWYLHTKEIMRIEKRIKAKALRREEKLKLEQLKID